MNRLNRRSLFKTLIIINFLITAILTGGNAQNSSPAKTPVSGNQQAKPPYSYKDNSQYVERTGHFAVYRKKGRIVMLGNSITARADWSELLNSNQIINRGIGSDITEGYLNRMEYIYSVKPKICYIMGGANDIARDVPRDATVQNMKRIIEGLKQHKIIPVLQSTLYVADNYPNSAVFNPKVESLNAELIKLAGECDITFLDLNLYLSSGKQLIREYAIKDGIHLTGAGYEKWRTVLLADLKQHRVKP